MVTSSRLAEEDCLSGRRHPLHGPLSEPSGGIPGVFIITPLRNTCGQADIIDISSLKLFLRANGEHKSEVQGGRLLGAKYFRRRPAYPYQGGGNASGKFLY